MRRGRLASMVPVALLLLGILEIVAIIAVGRWIGALATIGLLLLGFVLGVWLLKREGRRTWRALRTAASSGKMPSREIADASLVLVGGILLLIPGFITGVIGLFFALPFTRPLTRRVLEEYPRLNIVGEEWSGNPVVVSYWLRGGRNRNGIGMCSFNTDGSRL